MSNYRVVLCQLKRDHPEWARTIHVGDLSEYLTRFFVGSEILDIYLEALYQRKAAIRGTPRMWASRISQAAWIALDGEACRLLLSDPGIYPAHERVADGVERMPADLVERLKRIM